MASKEEATDALVEALDDAELGITLSTSGEPYISNDLEGLTELECTSMSTEEITAEVSEAPTIFTLDESQVTEVVLPDVEMTDVSQEEEVTEEIVATTVASATTDVPVLQAKPMLQRISGAQAKANVPQAQTQSIMIVSPASGGGAKQVLKISHPPTASADQLQSLAQSLISATDGSIIQIRPAPPKPTIATKTNVQTIKTEPGKRIISSNQNKNVYTKMILTGSQGGQQMLIATTQNDQKPVKISNANSSNATAGTKYITIEQAQQMGLIQTNKPLSSGVQKSNVPSSQVGKLTLVQTPRSPTKILPAQTQSKNQVSYNKNQSNTQKVVIRQSSNKMGSMQGGNQIIRIPSGQAGQIHQIQVPGRQVQYVRLVNTPPAAPNNVGSVKSKTGTFQTVSVAQKINNQQQVVKVVPLNSGGQNLRPVAPKTAARPSNQRFIVPANKNTVTIPASALGQLASGQAVLQTSNLNNIVVLPAQYVAQQEDIKPKLQPVPKLINTSQNSQNVLNVSNTSLPDSKLQKSLNNSDPNGLRTRKPCNCTKSQCLKLYCDCFANGEFCHMCNCNNCSNNLGNEEERQRAIKSCLERNPNAFRPKIGKAKEVGDDVRRHNKGCNCKRSGCLKNYCECYEAKIPCSENCKCIGCRNVEEPNLSGQPSQDLSDSGESRSTTLNLNKAKMQQLADTSFRPPAVSNTGARQPFNFLTDKVVEMTCQCLMAQAEEAERDMLDNETSEKLIIEEFGRCLKEIIDSAQKAETS